MKKNILFLFLFCYGILYAQNTTLKTWIGAGYVQKIKINEFKFKIEIHQEFRVSDVIYNTKLNTFTELKTSKRLFKWLKIGLAYRLNYIGGLRHRFSVSNSIRYLKKKSNFRLRLKYQAEMQKNIPFTSVLRAKVLYKYKANKDYRPFVFAEILFKNTFNYSNFNEYRLGLGLDTDYKKKHNFKIGLIFINAINTDEIKNSFVLSLTYLFSK